VVEQIRGHRERCFGQHAHDDAASDPFHSRTSYLNATSSGSFFLEPFFCGVVIPEHLDMVGVADLLACIHVNEHSHLTIL
jgi:hypothetical protein